MNLQDKKENKVYCLSWAFDCQTSTEGVVVGKLDSIRELYGVLFEQKEKLLYVCITTVSDGDVIEEYSRFGVE